MKACSAPNFRVWDEYRGYEVCENRAKMQKDLCSILLASQLFSGPAVVLALAQVTCYLHLDLFFTGFALLSFPEENI